MGVRSIARRIGRRLGFNVHDNLDHLLQDPDVMEPVIKSAGFKDDEAFRAMLKNPGAHHDELGKEKCLG